MEHSNLGVDPRFRVIRELGGGAASRVFEVHDRLHDAPRALKIATQRGQIRRYRHEYQRLTQLRHPHIIRAFDFGVASTKMPYFTMQLVAGQDLGSFAADPQTLCILAIQILDALATLHLRGWVHRDVKPHNLLVVGVGAAAVVQLVDFGLLTRAGHRASSSGTLPYMAPEVCRGEVIDGRADLFSLGMVLYETLLPHDVPQTVEEVARQHRDKLAAPAHISPVIPTGLSDFIMRLIEPNPSDRFDDAIVASDVLSQIKGLRLSRGPKAAAAERLLRGGAVSHRSVLLRQLRRIAATVRENRRGVMVTVVGDRGCGKTPFLRELSTQLNLDGMRVVRLRTSNHPGSPLGALLRIAREVGKTLATPPARLFSGRTRVSDVSAFAGQVAMAIASLDDRPTAFLIDDFHRAAPIALAVLRSLTARLNKLPFLLVCAAEQPSQSESFAATLASIEEGVLHLGPLNRSEVQALARHRLAGVEVPKSALERLHRDSCGMPSLVERTLARMLSQGMLQRDGALVKFAEGTYQAASHGDMAKTLVEKSKPSHSPILWAAAVLGHDIDAQAAAAIAGVTQQEAGSTLATLARLEILKLAPAVKHPRFNFVNRHVLEEAYQHIPRDLRTQLHDKAAEILQRRDDNSDLLDERVEHLLKGSRTRSAVVAAVEAGDRAISLFADRRAIDYYSRALAIIDRTDPDTAAISLKLARVFERVGELRRAITWYDAALASASPRNDPTLDNRHLPIAIEATLGLGAVEHARGNAGATAEHATDALELLQSHPDARLTAMAHRLQGLVATRIGDSNLAESLLLETLSELEELGAQKEIIELLLDLAQYWREQGELVKAVRCARRAQQRARAHNDASALAAASTILGRGFARAGRFRAARLALRYGLQTARHNGDQLRQALVLREIGNIRVRQGDLRSALRRYQRGLELIRLCHARTDESSILHSIAMVRARFGDFRASLIALHAAADLSKQASDVQGEASAALGLGHVYAQLGDLAHARLHLTAALEAGQSIPNAALTASASAIRAWVEMRAGHTAGTHQLFAILDDLLGPLQDPADQAVPLQYATQCAVLLQEGERAKKFAEQLRAVVRVGRLGVLVPVAIALRAEAAALLGQHSRANEFFRRGAIIAARLGLRPVEIEARVALARLLGPTDVAAAEVTRAMELLRDMAQAMPIEMATAFLTTCEAEQIRRDFARHRQRMLV